MKIEVSKEKLDEWCEIIGRISLDYPEGHEIEQVWDELDLLRK